MALAVRPFFCFEIPELVWLALCRILSDLQILMHVSSSNKLDNVKKRYETHDRDLFCTIVEHSTCRHERDSSRSELYMYMYTRIAVV